MRKQSLTRALVLFFSLLLVLGVAAQVVLAMGKPSKRPPTDLGLPKISGASTVGTTLKASHGRWTGARSYAYAWERCNAHGAKCRVIHRPALSGRNAPSDSRRTATRPAWRMWGTGSGSR